MQIELDFPFVPQPRWGYGRAPHSRLEALINAHRSRYARRLTGFLRYQDDFGRIQSDDNPSTPMAPYWNNAWFSGLDAVALYGFIRDERPRFYLEIGSGMSTKFARQAVQDGQLSTRIISIDPEPRAVVDGLCDQFIRDPLEQVPTAVFDMLQAGDILFIDGSHRVFTNSDTVVFFLEVLPALPPGVFVHIHDVFLPYDYPPDWSQRYYSEQYILGAMLLGGAQSMQIELPVAFVGYDTTLRSAAEPTWAGHSAGAFHIGGSFWLRTLSWRP